MPKRRVNPVDPDITKHASMKDEVIKKGNIVNKNFRIETQVAVEGVKSMIRKEIQLREIQKALYSEKNRILTNIRKKYDYRIDQIQKDVKGLRKSCIALLSNRQYVKLKQDIMKDRDEATRLDKAVKDRIEKSKDSPLLVTQKGDARDEIPENRPDPRRKENQPQPEEQPNLESDENEQKSI